MVRTVDIMEMLTNSIYETLFENWKHEGSIGGFTSQDIKFTVDGKKYVLKIRELSDGENLY